jgi:putative endonuclease
LVRDYYVYILCNEHRTLYIGVTNDLHARMFEHRNGLGDSFTRRYGIDRLVYMETTKYVTEAIAREKQLKGWLRWGKVALIESVNPGWEDLAASWFALNEADESVREEGPWQPRL